MSPWIFICARLQDLFAKLKTEKWISGWRGLQKLWFDDSKGAVSEGGSLCKVVQRIFGTHTTSHIVCTSRTAIRSSKLIFSYALFIYLDLALSYSICKLKYIWSWTQTAAAALGALYFYVLAHQQDFDVRWCKGSIAERIFKPWLFAIENLGGQVLGGKRVQNIVCSDGSKVSAVTSSKLSEPSCLELF